MRTPRKKLNGIEGITGERKPSALTLALIRQFAHCFHVERKFPIPDNTFFIN